MSQRDEVEAAIVAALNHYQASTVRSMAAAHGLNLADGSRKNGLVAELGRRLTDGTGIPDLIARLEPAQVVALQAFAGRDARLPLTSIRTLLRRHTPTAADHLLHELLATGVLLFDGHGTTWKLDLSEADPTTINRHVWSPPAVQATLPPPPAWDQVVERVPPPGRVLAGDPGELLRDMYLLLRTVRGRPLRLTRQNTVHQSDLKRLLAEMRPHLDSAGREAATDDLPFWLGLAVGAQLLIGRGAEVVAGPAAEAFLMAPRERQVTALLLAWSVVDWSELDRVASLRVDPWGSPFADVPNVDDLRQARTILVTAARDLAAAGWWSVDSLAAAIRLRHPDFVTGGDRGADLLHWGYWPVPRTDSASYHGIRRADAADYQAGLLSKETDWDAVEGAYIRQVLLEPLRWLGIVDVGVDPDGRVTAARLSPLGRQVLTGPTPAPEAERSARRLIVQPNFEIVVPDAGANLNLLAQLDTFATGRGVDRAAIYMLTRESVVAAVHRGTRLAEIEGLLEREGGELPQNVRYSLAEWARQAERVALRRGVTLLEADSVEQLDAWQTDPNLASRLGRRLSATVVEVPGEHVAAVEARLKRRAGWRVEAAAAASVGALAIAADGTLALSAAADTRWERHRLASLAEPGPADQPRTFRLTPASLARARALGWSAAQTLAFLEQRAGGAVVRDLALRVRGWMGQLGPAKQAMVHVVILPEAGLWRIIEPAGRAGLVQRLGPTAVLADEPGLAAMTAALDDIGVTVEAATPANVAAAWQTGDSAPAESALQTLRGKALRAYIESAIAGKQRLTVLHQSANQKSPRRLTVTPRWIENRYSGHVLVAVADSGAQRVIRLDDIFGVATEEGA